MPFDAIAVSAVRYELEQKMLGAKIEKIHQPEKDEIWIFAKAGKEVFKLLISADSGNPRIHLTENTKQNPASAPMFCMLLRKHLGGGRIVSVSQPDFERIIDIGIECYNELGDLQTKHLVAEIMGRHSNIILVDGGKVADSIKRVDITVSSVRNILPGLSYVLPPKQDKIDIRSADKEQIREALLEAHPETPIEKAVVSCFAGFSPFAGRELAHLATGQSDARLTEDNIPRLCEALHAFGEKIKNNTFCPLVIEDAVTGKAIDFAAYDVTMYAGGVRLRSHEGISRAMDEFFYARDKWERMRQKTAALRKTVTNALERCKKKLVLQQEKLEEAEQKDKWRIFGDLITANLYNIMPGQKAVSLENFYEEGSPVIEVPMDETKTPAKNAEAYFKKYRKAKTAQEIVRVQAEKNLEQIEYLSTVLGSIDIAENVQDIADIRKELAQAGYIKSKVKGKKEKDLPSAPLFFECEGYEIYVGRNNRQNDIVTTKMGKSYDVWLHVKNMPGSHVLIKNKGTDVPDSVIEKAAGLAAYYSGARESAMVQVDYTNIKNVKKPSGSMPGKVIYERYKTAYVAPNIF